MINPLPILILGGGAILLLGKKGNAKSVKASSRCPQTVRFDLSKIESVDILVDNDRISIPKIAVDLVKRGEKDIIKLTSSVLGQQINRSCLGDAKVSVTIDKIPSAISAPMLFFIVGRELVEDLHAARLISDNEASKAAVEIVNWWNDKFPGNPLPN